jgi:hypothetical protein
MIMKALQSLLVSGLLILSIICLNHKPLAAQPNKARQQTMRFINQTGKVLVSAKKALASNKENKKELFKAYAHQKQAKRLFAEKNYKQAVHHSYRAREIAQQIAPKPKGKGQRARNFSKEEETIIKDLPKTDELDSVIKETELNESIINEEVEKPETR